MGTRSDGAEVAQTSDDALRKPSPVVNVEQEFRGGSVPTDETGETSMASSRLIPVPDDPQLSVQLPPDTGRPSPSFDRNCAPFGL